MKTELEMMDEEFKFWFLSYSFSNWLYDYNNWINEITDMKANWTKYIRQINWKDFVRSFSKSCKELDLPWMNYNFERAIENVYCDWKNELILELSARIIYWRTDNHEKYIVRWNSRDDNIEIFFDSP